MSSRWFNSPAVVLLCLCGVLKGSVASRPVAAQEYNVLAFHNDGARLGWNARETALTPATVKSPTFGKLWERELDGGVPGSPLYVDGLEVGGQKRAVVYATTDCNSVYALDASTGEIIWAHKRLAEPLSDAQFTGSWFGNGKHGILSTPVIDMATGTLYACGVRARGFKQLYVVWALDISTGAMRSGWPIVLKGTYKGKPFVPGQVMQRGALSLVDGWLYVPFGGRGDVPPWRGWLFGIDTRHPEASQRAFCSSPYTDGAGIWSGGGVANDAQGDLFIATGNGDFDGNRGGDNLSQSVVRFHGGRPDFDFHGQKTDIYTPANYKFLDDEDEDLGGATPLILPDFPGTTTPHLLFTGGKDGLAYLLNRDNLGGTGGEIQKMRLYGDPKAIYHEGIRSTSAYFDAGTAGRFIFVAGDQPGPGARGLAALQLSPDGTGGPVTMKQVWTLKSDFNGPSSPVVSSDGDHDAIIWLVETNDGRQSSLRAYEAMTGAELYNSNLATPHDHFDGGRRFTSPIVANGRVFIGANGVVSFGLVGAEAGKGR
jgi:outer membrane protein assembly factor BamB